MTPELPKEALIDSDFLSYRIGFATAGESQQAARARLKEWLDTLLYHTLNIEDYHLFLTGKGNFRDEIAVTKPYKGNREGFVRPEHYQYLRDIMVEDYGASVSEGEEADDVVAYTSCTGDYILVHVDKDLDQLVGHHYNPVKNEWYYVDEFTGLYSFYTQLLMEIEQTTSPVSVKWGLKQQQRFLQTRSLKKTLRKPSGRLTKSMEKQLNT